MFFQFFLKNLMGFDIKFTIIYRNLNGMSLDQIEQ